MADTEIFKPNYSDEDKNKFVNSEIINKYELYGEGVTTIYDPKFKTIKELKDAGCSVDLKLITDADSAENYNGDNVFPTANRVYRKVDDKPLEQLTLNVTNQINTFHDTLEINGTTYSNVLQVDLIFVEGVNGYKPNFNNVDIECVPPILYPNNKILKCEINEYGLVQMILQTYVQWNTDDTIDEKLDFGYYYYGSNFLIKEYSGSKVVAKGETDFEIKKPIFYGLKLDRNIEFKTVDSIDIMGVVYKNCIQSSNKPIVLSNNINHPNVNYSTVDLSFKPTLGKILPATAVNTKTGEIAAVFQLDSNQNRVAGKLFFTEYSYMAGYGKFVAQGSVNIDYTKPTSVNTLNFEPKNFIFNRSNYVVITENVCIMNPFMSNPSNFEIKFTPTQAMHDGLQVTLGELINGYVTADFTLHLRFRVKVIIRSNSVTQIQMQSGYYVRGALEIIEYDTDGTTILSKGNLNVNFVELNDRN